jgi:hypothetical protein
VQGDLEGHPAGGAQSAGEDRAAVGEHAGRWPYPPTSEVRIGPPPAMP